MESFKLKGTLFVIGFAILMTGTAVILLPNQKQMGILQMESYQYSDSLDRLQTAYKKNPKDVVAIKSLSKVYGIMGDPEKEIEYLEKYIELRPKDIDSRFDLAKIYLWNLMQNKAKEQYQEILKIKPDHESVLRKLALSYRWDQKYKESVECYEKIKKLNKLIYDDYESLVDLHLGYSKLEKALEVSLEIKEKFPKKAGIDYYKGLADIYLWLGHKEKAAHTLNEMLANSNNNINARFAFIEWHVNKGLNKKVIPLLKEWIAEEPNVIPLRETLVDTYLQERENSLAISELENLVQNPKANEQSKIQLYWLMIEEKHLKKAYQLSKKIPDEMKEREGLWPSLGYLTLDLDLLDESFSIWNNLREKYPEDFEVRDGLFELYRKQGKMDLARQQLAWLIERKPDHPTYLEFQIHTSLEDKNYKKALSSAINGAQRYPNNDYFLESAAQSARELKKWDTAYHYIKILSDRKPEEFSYVRELLDIHIATEKYASAIPILDKEQYKHRNDDMILFTISEYYGWCNSPFRQLEILDTLEKKSPGKQFDDERLRVALDHNFYTISEEIVRRRLNANIEPANNFKLLFGIYTDWGKNNELYEMLKHGKANTWLGRETVLTYLVEVYQNKGEYIKALKAYEELFALSKNKDKVRKKMITVSGWADNPELEFEIYKNFADKKGEEGIKLAIMYNDRNQYQEALAVLKDLKEPFKNDKRVLELNYYLAISLKDQKLLPLALDRLIAQLPNGLQKARYLAERASLSYGNGKLEEASEDAQTAHQLAPDLNGPRLILGYIYYDKKEYRTAVRFFKMSELKTTYDRFLLAAALKRYPEGHREGLRIFHNMLREYRYERSFKKWNLYLDIGYELNDPNLLELAWDNLMQHHYRAELLPRYALHLLYTDRKKRAHDIFMQLEPSQKPAYIALQKAFAPNDFDGKLSENERMALAYSFQQNGDWLQAAKWLTY